MTINGKEILLTIKADGKPAIDQVKATVDELRKLEQAGAKAADALEDTSESLDDVGKEAHDAAKGTDHLGDSVRKTAKESSSLKEVWEKFATPLNQTIDLFERLKRVMDYGYEFAKMNADAAETRETFVALSRTVGLLPDQMVSQLRRATAGMISEVGLMGAAIKAINKDVSMDPQEIGKLLQISEALSDLAADGRSAQDVYNSLVDAIAKGTPKALVELGLLPESFSRASDAAEVLKTRQEMLNIVFDQGSEKLAILGDAGASSADKFAQLEASWQDLKTSGVELLAVVTPLVEKLAEAASFTATLLRSGKATSIAAQRINVEERERELADLRNANPTSGVSEMIEKKRVELADAQVHLATLVRQEKQMAQAADLKETNKLMSDFARSVDDALDKAKKGHAGAGQAAKAHKVELDALGKTMDTLSKTLMKGFYGSGSVEDSFGKAEAIMMAATRAAGGFAEALKDGVTEAGKLQETLEKASNEVMTGAVGNSNLRGMTPEKAGKMFMDFTGFGWAMRGEGKAKIEEVGDKVGETIREPIQVNVAEAFAEGLNEALLNGGDFFQAFGNALKRQVINAFTQSFTSSLFGSGGNILGSVGSSGTMYGASMNPLSMATGGISITGGSGSGGASTGILGGLMGKLFKPVMSKSGALNWGALGSNLLTAGVVGFAANRLFSEGGLFGGSHVHGQEWIQASADLNTQVTQAKELRDEIVKSVGITEATRQALEDATFNYTWTSKHKSGNGITSKKTTTYQLEGSGAAQASIEAIKKLQETAEGEQAFRTYDITKAAQYGGIQSLAMALQDVDNVVKHIYDLKEGSTTEYKYSKAEQADLLTQQLQRRSGLNTAIGAARNNAASYLFGNAYAAAEAGASPTYSTGTYSYTTGGGWLSKPTTRLGHYRYISDTGASALADIARGELGTTDDRGMIGYMMPTLKSTAEKDYLYQKSVIEAGDDPTKIAAVLDARKGTLSDALETYESIWKEAEKAAQDQTKSIEEQKAAFDRFQEAQNAVYQTKLELLQIEQQKTAALKAKTDALTQDILGTLSTRIGEVSENGAGQKVIVLSNGQPEGKALAIQLRDAFAGTNPELAKTMTDFIDAAGTRWN